MENNIKKEDWYVEDILGDVSRAYTTIMNEIQGRYAKRVSRTIDSIILKNVPKWYANLLVKYPVLKPLLFILIKFEIDYQSKGESYVTYKIYKKQIFKPKKYVRAVMFKHKFNIQLP